MKKGEIRIEGLSKKYPLYKRPSDKVLELLSLRRLKRHQEHWALRDLNLEIPPGTTLGVVGQNGSGKSTLLQIVAGILPPSSGLCRVGGSVAALLELGAGFNPEFSGRDNVYLNGALQGLTRTQIDRRMDEVLDFAEIGDFIDRPVKTYSSGMFLRLAFSAAIHVDPDVLLVDEALAVGDLIFQHRCINRIRRLGEQGKTILFVTHDLAAVTKFCDRALLLDRSRVLLDDTPEAVVHRYQRLVFEREQRRAGRERIQVRSGEDRNLPEVDGVPYIHHRYGEGGAEITGVLLQSARGEVLNQAGPGDDVLLLITAAVKKDLKNPIIGFTIRDHHGLEITSSNTAYEGVHLPDLKPGGKVTAGFRIKLPPMRPGTYSISPAVAQGDIWDHVVEDWIDNAYILSVEDAGLIYGLMRWPVQAAFRIHRSVGENDGAAP